MSDVRCPLCGYTEADAKFHMDHSLCKNAGNAPWEKRHTAPEAPEEPRGNDHAAPPPVCVYCMRPRSGHLGDGACDEGRSEFWLPVPPEPQPVGARPEKQEKRPEDILTQSPDDPPIEDRVYSYQTVRGLVDWRDKELSALRAENARLKKELAGLRESHEELEKALDNVVRGNNLALERGQSIENWRDSHFRKQAIAALANAAKLTELNEGK